ncbi:hypothetical protein SARC_06397 [Sphaeroforma arctica JP610]|uniref:Tryptophan synthase beta chain-like PALP domain-containing protein n=1 Tax=Sphaeroforma arctica JP610 TaxID=667725 RepID=A0A0L0FXI5_9EUKA|nr:hypothetical protein SARC_06397 [Sphaeroforma arctica JP610]KNC81266.1 hypothetical protein SARC_06397 [Sphaeroforma arctica JP610]|eukprot:XP_014155168.1 hypothetical protein SARC_06397 [Sphaeroforma arctica JP610]
MLGNVGCYTQICAYVGVGARHIRIQSCHSLHLLEQQACSLNHNRHACTVTSNILLTDRPSDLPHRRPTRRYTSHMPATKNMIEYTPPSWTDSVDKGCIPTHRIRLSMQHTPVEDWSQLPGVPKGVHVGIKRDDLTGSALGGNKVRKLEFLIAAALLQGCDSVITCGAVQSNHARATALAARSQGLDSHLFLRSNDPSNTNIGHQGNVLLDKLMGSTFHLLGRVPYKTGLLPPMKAFQDSEAVQGRKSFLIPVGGSDIVGWWGYVECFRELLQQGVDKDYTDIVVTTGSGGTAAGLAISNYLCGSPLKIHAVCVCDNADYFHRHINETLRELGLGGKKDSLRSQDIIDIIDGYKGKGYGLSQPEEFMLIRDVARSTAILLDPVYTAKGVRGMISELHANPQRFKGQNVLFLHTGGIFGLYDGTINPYLQDSTVTVVA